MPPTDAVEATSQENLDKQIDTALTGTPAEAVPAKEPAAAPEATPAATSDKADTTEKTPEVTDADPDADDTDKPAEPVLLAGKYKSSDELLKATDEILEKLELPIVQSLPLTDALERLIEKAKSTNDWSQVERFYKRVQSEVSRKQAEKSAQTKVKTTLSVLDKTAEDNEKIDETTRAQEVKRWEDFKAQRVHEKLQSNADLKERFRRAELAMPRNNEELEELRSANEYLYDRFMESVYDYNEQLEDLRVKHFETIDKTRTLMTERRDSLQKHIKAVNDKLRLELTDDEINADIDKVFDTEDPMLYEDQYGVLVPKEGGAEKYWRAMFLDKYIDKGILNHKAEARKETVKDLKEMREKTTGDLASTSSVPGKRADKTDKKITEATVKDASNEQLDSEINKVLGNISRG